MARLGGVLHFAIDDLGSPYLLINCWSPPLLGGGGAITLQLRAWTLGLGCLGFHPGFAVYEVYAFGRLCNHCHCPYLRNRAVNSTDLILRST